ncbi:hypothetical protein ACTU3I_02910 [Microbacterium sp. RD1]|uniref:hypothetical protein n=1 Tax=Microbacterium sp. RD1 TaxID=3457313 RepID=UPI003FA5FFAD
MIILLAFASLSVVAIAASVVALLRDGYRRVPARASMIPSRADAAPTPAASVSVRPQPHVNGRMRARVGA